MKTRFIAFQIDPLNDRAPDTATCVFSRILDIIHSCTDSKQLWPVRFNLLRIFDERFPNHKEYSTTLYQECVKLGDELIERRIEQASKKLEQAREIAEL